MDWTMEGKMGYKEGEVMGGREDGREQVGE